MQTSIRKKTEKERNQKKAKSERKQANVQKNRKEGEKIQRSFQSSL